MSILIDDAAVVAHFEKHPSPSATTVLKTFIDLSAPLEEHALVAEMRALKMSMLSDMKETTEKVMETTHAQTFKGLMESIARNEDAFLQRIKASKDETLRDEVLTLKAAQRTLFEEVKDLLKEINKTKVSSQAKGSASENEVAAVLNRLFPSAMVEDTRGHTGRGDFILKRQGRGDVMFENKFYNRNVDLVETTKFIRDAMNLKCSAVMMSQKTGIVNKEQFQVEIQDRVVLVYLHQVEYNEGLIRSAVDIIDQLEARLAGVSTTERETGVAIEKELLDKINAEFQQHLLNHQKAVAKMRDAFKIAEEEVRQLTLPNLAAFLTTTYPQQNASVKSFACAQCSRSFTSQLGLNGHMKTHK